MTFTTDAHALVWYVTGHKILGRKAKQSLETCFAGKTNLIIPTIALLELFHLHLKKPHIPFNSITSIIKRKNIIQFPLSQELLTICYQLPNQLEIHDRIIAATAKVTDTPLITKDKTIAKLALVKVIW